MAVRKSIRHWALLAGVSACSMAGCAAPPWGVQAQSNGPQNLPPDASHSYESTSRSDQKPDPVRLPLAYARWQEQLGNLTEAKSSYERVLDNDPKSTDAIIGLARIDQLSGRVFEAEQGFHQALKLRPQDPVVMDALGQFYASQERWPDAVAMLQKASQQAPTDTSYRYHLAVAMARSGDIEGARPHFSKTVGDAEAHYNVGYILYEKGQLEQAEQEFLQAILKKPQLEQAQAMYDDVRAEREDLQIAGGSGQRPASTLQARSSSSTNMPIDPAQDTNQSVVQTSAVASNRSSTASAQPASEFESADANRPVRQAAASRFPAAPAQAIDSPGPSHDSRLPDASAVPAAEAPPVGRHATSPHSTRQMPLEPPQWPAAPRRTAATRQQFDASTNGRFQAQPAGSGVHIPEPWHARAGGQPPANAQAQSFEGSPFYDQTPPDSSAGSEGQLPGGSVPLSPQQVEQLRNQQHNGF